MNIFLMALSIILILYFATLKITVKEEDVKKETIEKERKVYKIMGLLFFVSLFIECVKRF